MDLTPCGMCGRDTIAQYDWRDAPAALRQRWREDGLRQYKGRGLCSACYQRGKRGGFPPDETVAEAVAANERRSMLRPKGRTPSNSAPNETDRGTKNPVLPDPCRDCGVTLVRGYSWQHARAEKRREWVELGYRRARLPDLCNKCDAAKHRAEKKADRDARAALALQMRTSGMTVVDIAAMLKVSKSTVGRLAPPELIKNPHESPTVLAGGQWVTCPRRRIKVWREAS